MNYVENYQTKSYKDTANVYDEHHVKYREIVISEMLMISSKVIFISDSNNSGQGRYLIKSIKQLFNFMGLCSCIDFIKMSGKGYSVSNEDGLSYSYSVFNNYKQICQQYESTHFLNALNSKPDLYKTAPHVVLPGIKKNNYNLIN